jgi:transposase
MEPKPRVTQIGLDCHKKFSRVTARDENGKIAWRQRLEHANRDELRARLKTWPRGVPVVLEGTFGWGWLSDELKEAGLEPHLANSGKVAAWRKARGIAKSNRTDADLLSELPTESTWWEVWLAPPEVRDQREWLRYRMGLVKAQTQLKNRIHALLHRHGIVHEYADLFGTQGRRFLSLLVAPKDVTLRDSARSTLKGHLQLLDQVRRHIATATRSLRRQIKRNPTGERLRTLPGIDRILAYTILAEIGRIKRFASAKRLASYSLLVPRANDSGDEDDEIPKGRHVGRIGRRTLKWAFIEAAHGAVRKGGRYRAIFDRRTNGGKRDRNRGYIAVGHALCHATYGVWKKEIAYTADPPPRPGSRSASRTSRPGTGQPDLARVAAVVGSLQTSL